MAFNIDAFRTNGLSDGGARPAFFKVLMTFPQAITNSTTEQRHPFLISAATLPESFIGQVKAPYFGRDVNFAGDRVFGNWTVNVFNTEDFLLRKSFERWHAGINSIVPNLMLENWTPADYKTTAQVDQYSKAGPDEGNIIRTYHFDGLFPLEIDRIEVNWAAKDQFETFRVTFAYDYWVPTDLQNTGTIDDFN